MLFFVMIAAVCVAVFILFVVVRVVDGVVCPLPYAAAHGVRPLVKEIPILFQIAGTYAHCVAVFTEEERNLGVFAAELIIVRTVAFARYHLFDNLS